MSALTLNKMILRSLFHKPATLMYPVIQREWQELTRGHIENQIDDCIFCGICQKKCPTDAIAVDKSNKTWTIQRMQCIQCSSCVDNCPKHCLSNENTYTAPQTVKIIDTIVKPVEIPEVGEEKVG